VAGIPGSGNNDPAELTPPVLTELSDTYRNCLMEVSSAPPLVNYLVVEESTDPDFSDSSQSEIRVLPVTTHTLTVDRD
jgi:hypothetical protein